MIASRLLKYLVDDRGIDGLAEELGIDESTFSKIYNEEWVGMDDEELVRLIGRLEMETDKSIDYVIIDESLVPEPNLPDRAASIKKFGAPALLSGRNVDDFYQYMYIFSYYPEGGMARITRDDWMGSYLELPQMDPDTGQYFLVPMLNETEAKIYVKEDITRGIIYIPTPAYISYKSGFYNCTLYKIYWGTPPQTDQFVPGGYRFPENRLPCYGLKHFKVVFLDDTNSIVVAHYFPGAKVHGKILSETSQPLTGITIGIADEYGVVHDIDESDGGGNFDIIAPMGNLTIVGLRDGGRIIEKPLDINYEQAYRRADYNLTINLRLDTTSITGDIRGIVYEDVNADMRYDEGDKIIPGIEVSLVQNNAPITKVVSDSSGIYRFDRIEVGSYTITATKENYQGYAENYPNPVIVNLGETTEINVVMTSPVGM